MEFIIDGAEFNFMNGDELDLAVTSQRAEYDQKNNSLDLTNVTIEHMPTQRKVMAPEVFWDLKNETLDIPGWYIASSPKGTQKARGLSMDLDFNLTALKDRPNQAVQDLKKKRFSPKPRFKRKRR